ncbi:DNA-methyltransferase [Desulfospira joergensenii]|uniref:DNA-methyltransferase n=1 Tax=Desulfospira joergensenii TaxID=53329 RepID=UPI0003B61A72|nr:site-specific DNA-methyltransferase [Desulfospira joergensenii]
MKTEHTPIFSDASAMKDLPGNSVDLIVTSPPYPMIEMWDPVFTDQDPKIGQNLKKGEGQKAFEAMHRILDPVWEKCFRVLRPGGFACINIGDATRTIKERFSLYTNHARILSAALDIGFSALPCIIWRKQTNAPNKFMGSGMLPSGAYVTLEHEYILILRKGGKRIFRSGREKEIRHESALFWEERNTWFSDVWMDLKGTTQSLGDKAERKRSGAFPFALAYRLINMYSVKKDRVLDPFLGTGTTMAAAMAAGRNSLGYEKDPSLDTVLKRSLEDLPALAREIIRDRLIRHLQFVARRVEEKGPMKHINTPYGFPVMTSQERELILNTPLHMTLSDDGRYTLEYDPRPQEEFCRDWAALFAPASEARIKIPRHSEPAKGIKQGSLF